MAASTPSVNRSASGIMRSNASAVRTCSSVARMARSESAFPARVPPMPPTSTGPGGSAAATRRAVSSDMPYAAAGTPLASGFPTVRKSGSRSCARV